MLWKIYIYTYFFTFACSSASSLCIFVLWLFARLPADIFSLATYPFILCITCPSVDFCTSILLNRTIYVAIQEIKYCSSGVWIGIPFQLLVPWSIWILLTILGRQWYFHHSILFLIKFFLMCLIIAMNKRMWEVNGHRRKTWLPCRHISNFFSKSNSRKDCVLERLLVFYYEDRQGSSIFLDQMCFASSTLSLCLVGVSRHSGWSWCFE